MKMRSKGKPCNTYTTGSNIQHYVRFFDMHTPHAMWLGICKLWYIAYSSIHITNMYLCASIVIVYFISFCFE